jgi:deazaflavin-dependent oxidoreductase (nitroreductase family)
MNVSYQMGAEMDEHIRRALQRDRVFDITTIGRKSGKQHRIETAIFRDNGNLYLTGLPGRRDWYANLLVNPDFTIHVKQSGVADVPARAIPITDADARQAIIGRIVTGIGRTGEVDAWAQNSPLALVEIDGWSTSV